jgi:hypothetical protein
MARGVAGAIIVMVALSTWNAAPLAESMSAYRSPRHYTVRPAARPTVSPQSGDAHTTFEIRFTSRVKLGRHRGYALEYDLDAFEGNQHPTVGCEGSFGDAIRHGSAGKRLMFRERPATTAGWCPSRYRGTIRLVATYSCGPSSSSFLCNPRTKALVGRLGWRVRRG